MVELRKVSLDEVRSFDDDPTLRIKTEEDVETWKKTQSFADYSIFLRRLTDSVVNYYLPWSSDVAAQVCKSRDLSTFHLIKCREL
jgi:serine/threonine-protein phosphatase 2A activator